MYPISIPVYLQSCSSSASQLFWEHSRWNVTQLLFACYWLLCKSHEPYHYHGLLKETDGNWQGRLVRQCNQVSNSSKKNDLNESNVQIKDEEKKKQRYRMGTAKCKKTGSSQVSCHCQTTELPFLSDLMGREDETEAIFVWS